MKMSVNDAAEYFGVSKEAIHNRVRRGSLEVVVEDGIKMVVVDEKANPATPKKTVRRATTPRASSNNDRYYKFLEEQNAKLQSRVETLEGETRSLRDQKELMLVQEREKIEAIYKEKDEQLKNILSTLASQFMLGTPESQTDEIETVDVEVEDVQEAEKESAPEEPLKATDANIVTLKKFVKELKVSEKKAKKIIARFEKKAQKDRRIITLGEKIYLDTLRYDYSDLVKK
jgi:TolA-binding protein